MVYGKKKEEEVRYIYAEFTLEVLDFLNFTISDF